MKAIRHPRIVLRVWLVCIAVALAALFPSKEYQFWKASEVVAAARAECLRIERGEVSSVVSIRQQDNAWRFPFSSEMPSSESLPPPEVTVSFNGRHAYVNLQIIHGSDLKWK